MVTVEMKTLRLRNGQELDYKTQLAEIVRRVTPLDPQGAAEDRFSGYGYGRGRSAG